VRGLTRGHRPAGRRPARVLRLAAGAVRLDGRAGARHQRLTAHADAGEIAIAVERLPLDRVADARQLQARGPHRKLTIVP
jgi:hypothetical protein